jgi:hypothetical protein
MLFKGKHIYINVHTGRGCLKIVESLRHRIIMGKEMINQAIIDLYLGSDPYQIYAWQILAIFAYLYHQPGMEIAH